MKFLKVKEAAVTVPELVETLVANGYQHHYPLAYGDLSAAALEMAAYLGIPVIETELYTDYFQSR